MFVIFAVLISIAFIGFMYHLAKTRESSFKNKYDQVSNLRQLVFYCRQHRGESHNILIKSSNDREKLEDTARSILLLSDHLVDKTDFENKPVYRILQTRIKKLLNDWESAGVGQNQMIHGKTIRHCLFLIDEIMLSWLLESQRNKLMEEYNLNWQQIFDALESLTQFRITIQDIDTENGYLRFKNNAAAINRRLQQIIQTKPSLSISLESKNVIDQLNIITASDEPVLTQDELYKISSDISLVIFNVYDCMLEEAIGEIYVPLPDLVVAV